MNENSDANLVQECLAGNTRAFEALVERYQKTIFNIAYRMAGNYDDAEDITQSVFIKSYEKLGGFNPKFKFFSWLYRIALNESLNHLHRRKQLAGLDDVVLIKGTTPADEYNEMETNEQIQDVLMLIEPEQRLLLVLKHFEGFSYEEIAFCLDISEKKVKSRLFDARRVLKDLLITRGIVSYE